MTPFDLADDGNRLLVACLCAQWCSVCREWRATFSALGEQFPHVGWLWIDIEDEADALADLEIDNFPVLAVQRGPFLLYCATVPQHVAMWKRLIQQLEGINAQTLGDYSGAASRSVGNALDLREFASRVREQPCSEINKPQSPKARS